MTLSQKNKNLVLQTKTTERIEYKAEKVNKKNGT